MDHLTKIAFCTFDHPDFHTEMKETGMNAFRQQFIGCPFPPATHPHSGPYLDHHLLAAQQDARVDLSTA